MITYPVDVENTRWSVASIATGLIIKHNKPWPRADGAEVIGLDADIALLLEVREAQPAYDPATHKLQSVAGVIDILGNTHTHGWQTVALSQDELDTIAEREAAKAAYTALKAHSGTADECATLLENVVAYMLKDQYGS